MTTNNVFKELTTKKFSYYYFDEFTSKISFLEVLGLLSEFSDFFHFDKDEQKSIANSWLKKKEIYIDCDRIIKIF